MKRVFKPYKERLKLIDDIKKAIDEEIKDNDNWKIIITNENITLEYCCSKIDTSTIPFRKYKYGQKYTLFYDLIPKNDHIRLIKETIHSMLNEMSRSSTKN